jgi:F-box-like
MYNTTNKQLDQSIPASHLIKESSENAIAIADLPEEILLTIFSFLPANTLMTMQCVCKLFTQLARDNFLWKKLIIPLS